MGKLIMLLALLLAGCGIGAHCGGGDVACYRAALLSECLEGATNAGSNSPFAESVRACNEVVLSVDN